MCNEICSLHLFHPLLRSSADGPGEQVQIYISAFGQWLHINPGTGGAPLRKAPPHMGPVPRTLALWGHGANHCTRRPFATRPACKEENLYSHRLLQTPYWSTESFLFDIKMSHLLTLRRRPFVVPPFCHSAFSWLNPHQVNKGKSNVKIEKWPLVLVTADVSGVTTD